MRALFRERFGISGLLAIVALVFAMTGGALAAKGVIITKLSQIKPSVQKQLQGKEGKAGATGLQGSTGPAGPAGPKGDPGNNGAPGADGEDGKSVTATPIPAEETECGGQGGALVKEQGASSGIEVCNGNDGEDGSPWVAGTAPGGVQLKGTWAIQQYTAAAADEEISVPFTTGIPVNATPSQPVIPVFVIGGVEEAPAAIPGGPFCTGDPNNPTSNKPGILCAYSAGSTNLKGNPFDFGVVITSGGGAVGHPRSVEAGLVKAQGSWALMTP